MDTMVSALAVGGRSRTHRERGESDLAGNRTESSYVIAREPRRFGSVFGFCRDSARPGDCYAIAGAPRACDDRGHAVTLAGRATSTENSDWLLEGSAILATHLSVPWQDVRVGKTAVICGT